MAHLISVTSSGIAEAAYALQPAWHGLGTVLNEVPDSATMIKAAHLDWGVEMIDMSGTVKGGAQDGLFVPSAKKQVVRTDTFAELGVVSDNYGLVQPAEAFEFTDSLLQDGIMKYEAAGALKGGRIVWVLARMPEVDEIAADDVTHRYVLFVTSFDGSMKLHAIPTSVRVVCHNTLSLAVSGLEGIRHIGDMSQKMDMARKYISQFNSKFTLFRDHGRKLASVKIDPTGAKAFLDELLPPPAQDAGKKAQTMYTNRINSIRDSYASARNNGLSSIRGTWWAMLNSFTEVIDHDSIFKGEGQDRAENRMLSLVDGSGADLKKKAYKLALQGAGV